MNMYDVIVKVIDEFTILHGQRPAYVELTPADDKALETEMRKPVFSVNGIQLKVDTQMTPGSARAFDQKRSLSMASQFVPKSSMSPVPPNPPNCYNVYDEVLYAIHDFDVASGGLPTLVTISNKDYAQLHNASSVTHSPTGHIYVRGINCVADKYCADGVVYCSDSNSVRAFKMGGKNPYSANVTTAVPVQAHVYKAPVAAYQTNIQVTSDGDCLIKTTWDPAEVKKCECGSAAVGSSMHSPWCPEHTD